MRNSLHPRLFLLNPRASKRYNVNFKDQLIHDLNKVFLNLGEFAETHRVEGKQIPVVIDSDSFVKMKQGQILGMVEADLLLMAKTEDLPPEKSPGSFLNIDGREYIVEKWGVNMGFAEVALRQNRTM